MKPVLVIMAAGMGSRYGGLKQIDKIGPNGEIILELSCFDALRAGFEEVVFIIRKEIEEDFKELVGNKLSKFINVKYIIQDIHNLPTGFKTPADRTKPWGTAHAILCTKGIVKSPFVVINADDYYGKESFKLMYDFLSQNNDENYHSMVGYKLSNTLSENGHVARGICKVEDDQLIGVVERTKIIKKGEAAFYTEDDINWIEADYNGIVSMNMWGFMPSIFDKIETGFIEFLQNKVKEDPLKSEYYIPTVVGELLTTNQAKVKVMTSKDRWYGVTYKEDKKLVSNAIEELINKGVYPKKIWEEVDRNGN